MTKALAAGQAAAAAGLRPLAELSVAEAARRVGALREVLQGGLGLSTGGRAKRGQEVRLLTGLRGTGWLWARPGRGGTRAQLPMERLGWSCARRSRWSQLDG